MPKVSVLIPAYNYAHYLDEAIESVLQQTYTDYELIIVDNHSTDNTEEVVGKYLKDERVSYFKNNTNIGIVGNLNKCLDYAHGEYIKFLMADDKFHPQLLEKYVAVMEQYPNVSLITCDKQAFDRSSKIVKLPFQNLQNGKEMILHTLSRHCWIGEPTSVMFRKKDTALGNFKSEYTCHVDWDMWLRLLTVGDCYIFPEPLAYVRFHAGQHTHEVNKKKFITCFEEYQLCRNVKDGNGFNIDVSGSNIDASVKKRATYCATKAMYKVIPKLYKKEMRPIFKKAFNIAYKEKVIGSALLEMLRGDNREAWEKKKVVAQQ